MPGPVVQLSDPWGWVPEWLKPQGASVTDPAWVPPVRYTFNKAVDVIHFLGLDDPQQQVLGLMGAMTAPGGEASPAAAALEKAAEKFPRLAKVIRAYKGGYPYNAAGEPITEFKSVGVPMEGAFENYVGKKGGFAGFFSDDPAVANRFAGPQGAVYPVDIQPFKNPLVIDAQGSYSANMQYADMAKKPHEKAALLEMWDTLRGKNSGNYDGIVIHNTADEGTVFVPLNSEQVSSAFAKPVIKGFHGSGSDFDQFSSEFIGTGEGAQAYGHGLYMAENEGVAKGYRDAVARGNSVTNEQLADYFQPGNIVHGYAGMDRVLEYTPPTSDRMWNVKVERVKQAPTGEWVATEPPRIHATAPTGREYAAATGKPIGKMYEVAIHADPEHFLDWDKPLSEQSEKARSAWYAAYQQRYGRVPQLSRDISGAQAMEMLGAGDRKIASEQLAKQGIPGIKYLDQGSRNRTDIAFVQEEIKKTQAYVDRLSAIYEKNPGDSRLLDAARDSLEFHKQILAEGLKEPPATRNYVVFDDKLISILKKYGIAAPAIEILRRKSQDQGGKLSESDLQGLY